MGEIWREELEIPNIEKVIQKLWQDIKPFYQVLHAVLRHIASQHFTDIKDFVEELGLPAHLGPIGTNWNMYSHLILPSNINLDEEIISTKWTPEDMVKRADDYYSSLGLPLMPDKFWRHSVFQKMDNSTKCHGTAANMFNDDDFRMIVCSDRSFYDFYVTVHEMGHIHYYMACKNQPAIFQDGNSALQESIGDMVYLAMMAPQHLNRLRLIDDKFLIPKDNEQMNYFDYTLLLKLALEKIPQIPLSLIIDEFRWDLFSGKVPLHEANKYFWHLSEKEQGIRPPDWLDRSGLFDAAAYFHFADNTPKIRYFLASFLQVQILEGLCKVTVFEKVKTNKELPMPLHRCDLYGSKKAGKLLK